VKTTAMFQLFERKQIIRNISEAFGKSITWTESCPSWHFLKSMHVWSILVASSGFWSLLVILLKILSYTLN